MLSVIIMGGLQMILIDPTGTQHSVIWLRPFCRQHGLDSGNMTRVVNGQRKHHKGWTCPEAGYVRTYTSNQR